MVGIFVNENGGIRYAQAIVQGYKPVETRSRNMLGKLIGNRVAVVRTRRGKNPMIVGYATIERADWFCQAVANGVEMRRFTRIPEGSIHDSGPKGKWFYWLSHPEVCDPYPLPADAVRQGRSWCEF